MQFIQIRQARQGTYVADSVPPQIQVFQICHVFERFDIGVAVK
jgi:hypothetical protein